MRCIAMLVTGATLVGATASDAQVSRGKPSSAEQSMYCWMDRTLSSRQPLVVDLILRADHLGRLPGSADSTAVYRHNGRITHAFRVGVLRAVVDTGALRALLAPRTGIADMAFVVTDTSRRDVNVQVHFRHALRTEDSVAIAAAGGNVFMFRPGHRPANAHVPDSLIPRLAALPGVTHVRAWPIQCVTVGTGTTP
jgi:hypothetical protein